MGILCVFNNSLLESRKICDCSPDNKLSAKKNTAEMCDTRCSILSLVILSKSRRCYQHRQFHFSNWYHICHNDVQMMWANSNSCYLKSSYRMDYSMMIYPNNNAVTGCVTSTVIVTVKINTLRPRQMAAIFQTTFWNVFSWMKMFEFRVKFHWSLFLKVQLTMLQHWSR